MSRVPRLVQRIEGGNGEILFIFVPNALRSVVDFGYELSLSRLSVHFEPPARFGHIVVSFSDVLPYCLDDLTLFLRSLPVPPDNGSIMFSLEPRVNANRPALVDATFELYQAWLDNPHLAAIEKEIYVPVAPPQPVVDRIVQRSAVEPMLNLFVVPDAVPREEFLEIMPLGEARFRIASIAEQAPRVIESLLMCRGEDARAGLNFNVTSPTLPAVVTVLQENRAHKHKAFEFNSALGFGQLDGTDLCTAAFQCPTVVALTFTNFSLVRAAENKPPTNVQPVPLKSLLLVACTLGPGSLDVLSGRAFEELALRRCSTDAPNEDDFRVCDLAIAMWSRSSNLVSLFLLGTPMSLRDMTRLCGMLVAAGCGLVTLGLGGETSECSSCLNSDCLEHFFRQLPQMKSLKLLFLHHVAPPSLSQIILEGIKSNYELKFLTGLTFESGNCFAKEVAAYIEANARGRRYVHTAASDPANQWLLCNALATFLRIVRRGNLDVEDDEGDDDEEKAKKADYFTSLYLCVRHFTPAYVSLHNKDSSPGRCVDNEAVGGTADPDEG
jgi:hypothetical protein